MKQENAWKFAGLEHPREEETAPTQSFFPTAFCFNLCRQPFLWLTKVFAVHYVLKCVHYVGRILQGLPE
ncbi:hypothetical protein Taro_014649, partial [Colocasia esculenta]|nr:hypothetical protein [Colocasia esculenta]